MSRCREQGFTLVELMIVVVIIGILASIAIPKFASIVGKAKISEAKTILNEVITIESAFFFQEQVFRDFDDADIPEIGWTRPANSRFTYKFVTDAADATKGLATATEVGDVDGNGLNDTDGLTLDTDKNRGNLTPDMAW